jgi:hypothetical protein
MKSLARRVMQSLAHKSNAITISCWKQSLQDIPLFGDVEGNQIPVASCRAVAFIETVCRFLVDSYATLHRHHLVISRFLLMAIVTAIRVRFPNRSHLL